MSLPPGFLDELRTRLSITDVVGRKVLWDMRKSNQAKGDMWAPCPFHQEKSASFHVIEPKGYYYCFGCQAKGDAISFVRETENVGFMEAVEILAQEAGMPMPKRDPQAQARADRRTELAQVMDVAQRYYRMQLNSGAATEARAYLERRGLAAQTLETFGLGFAPGGWQALWDHLRGSGVAEDKILECGLAKPSSRGDKPYDVFRNRIMFPIRDSRGQVIAFGGRAMDPGDNAKYLNSPETALFDKGRSLYNYAPAREAVGKGQPLIVAEGYMDVIALAQAGFGGAVAPLGTAVTETQLHMLWRVSNEPVVALDGDTAGLRAAYRVIDNALPLLEAPRSLRFAILPQGKDPDDLIRAEGPQAFAAVLDAAQPMVQLLWRREIDGKDFDSPERKAALDKALREKIMLIKDPSLRSHYGQTIKELRYQLFRPRRASGGKPWTGGGGNGGFGGRGFGRNAPAVPMPGTRMSSLVSGGEGAEVELRLKVIFAALLCTPQILDEVEGQIETLDCPDPSLGVLRDCLLANVGADREQMMNAARDAIGADALENLFATGHVAIMPAVRKPGDADIARMTVTEELAKLEANHARRVEIEEASADIGDMDAGDEAAAKAVTWRLGQAAQAVNTAQRSEREENAEFDVGPNGLRLDRDEHTRFAATLGNITIEKRKK